MAPEEVQSLRERAEAMIRSAAEAWSSGNRSAAVSVNEAALEVCRGLVRPSATPAHEDVGLLLACLRNANTMRRELGFGEDALAFAQEAVAVCREHANASYLASCLNSLGVTYRALGRLGDAITATDEATVVIWPEFEANPSELGDTVDILLRNLGRWHEEAGHSVPSALVERRNAFRLTLQGRHRDQPAAAAAAPAVGGVELVERLLDVVAKAAVTEKALHGDEKIVGWACQLMDLLLSLAWRIRGRHMAIGSRDDGMAGPRFVVVLPSESPEVVPMKAMGAARTVMAELGEGSQPSAAALDARAKTLRGAPSGDPLVRVSRSVENAGRAGALTLQFINDVTEALLAALRATAVEFEASQPKMAEPGYVGELAMMPIAGVLTPARGEAMRVLSHVMEVTEQHFGTKIVAVV